MGKGVKVRRRNLKRRRSELSNTSHPPAAAALRSLDPVLKAELLKQIMGGQLGDILQRPAFQQLRQTGGEGIGQFFADIDSHCNSEKKRCCRLQRDGRAARPILCETCRRIWSERS